MAFYANPNLKQVNKIIKHTHCWAFNAVGSVPVFKADVYLIESPACPKRPTPVILKKIEEMKAKEPQVLTGCWVDSNNTLLAVYFSQGETKMPNGKEVAKGDN
jgi:hypothetical protein